MLSGQTVENALESALKVTDKAIENSDTWYGLAFESALEDF